MKIIISPAKVMKVKTTTIKTVLPPYLAKTKILKQELQTYDKDALHDLMKISFKMATTVYSYYHDEYEYTPAIYCYQGTVYKQLNLNTYQDKHFRYLKEHLSILSAYYGTLEYNSAITPYRLDMGMKIKYNLYSFWQETIDNYFNDEDYIICLASNEFAKMLKHPRLINLDFVELKGGKLTRNAMYIKTARGKMLDMMVKYQVTSLAQLKCLKVDEYHFDEVLSTDNNYVFLRQATPKYKKL